MKGNNKLSINRTGLSLAITMDAISIICLLLIAVLPRSIVSAASSGVFHLMDNMMASVISLQAALIGLITLSIFGYLAGAIFALSYNAIKE